MSNSGMPEAGDGGTISIWAILLLIAITMSIALTYFFKDAIASADQYDGSLKSILTLNIPLMPIFALAIFFTASWVYGRMKHDG
jgi:hypothetical protein